MQRILSHKLLTILLLIGLLLIGLSLIHGTLMERQSSRNRVMTDIAASNIGPQAVLGPVLVVPVQESYDCSKDEQILQCKRRYLLSLTPQNSRWTNTVHVSDGAFKRGIYQAITWQDNLTMQGQFAVDLNRLALTANQQVDWAHAELRVYLSDLRGLRSQPVLDLNGHKLSFAFPSDNHSNALDTGYTALPLPLNGANQVLPFTLNLSLAGMDRLQLLPIGGEFSANLQANWPHPMFFGASLPEKQWQKQGFSAEWQNAFLASRNTQQLATCLAGNDSDACTNLQRLLRADNSDGQYDGEGHLRLNAGFGVAFIHPVDIYLQSERATKYALLFLIMTFGAFFLFEVLRDLRIHPLQYGLVGAALLVFYLLLLSLSEQLGFALAYLASSSACIGLIVFYLGTVLRGTLRALGLGSLLAVMYGTLYLILQSEDYTLMLGSTLVFLLLATVMTLTRHIDWYALPDKSVTPPHS